MPPTIDVNAIQAAFAQPHFDGSFHPSVTNYLRSVSLRKRMLLLAFAPKAAGTFFRHAAIYATGGQLMRLSHAQGGRDGTPYLPNVLAAYLDEERSDPVCHIHMQALAANRNFIDAFGIKPVIMIRDVADLLASFLEMLETDPVARSEGLNCQVPSNFVTMGHREKSEFMMTMIAPWYASYFATWKEFSDAAPETVCVMHYPQFRLAPGPALHRALTHAGFSIPAQRCNEAVDRAWRERQSFRFNRGVAGRGRDYFTRDQYARLSGMLASYPQLEPWLPDLLESGHD